MMGLLVMAVSKGIDVASLERLTALKERDDQRRAERAFNEAMVRFQSRCPNVKKNKTAMAGKAEYDYVTLDEITRTVSPILAECGLSYRFDSVATERSITVTCTVYHIAGHSRSSSFPAAIEGTSAMNNTQRTASGLTYARRYAMLLALGIGTADIDDDAAACVDHADDSVTQPELNGLMTRLRVHVQDPRERESFAKSWGAGPGDLRDAMSWSRAAYAAGLAFVRQQEATSPSPPTPPISPAPTPPAPPPTHPSSAVNSLLTASRR